MEGIGIEGLACVITHIAHRAGTSVHLAFMPRASSCDVDSASLHRHDLTRSNALLSKVRPVIEVIEGQRLVRPRYQIAIEMMLS